jgi:hypothetical protein
VVAAFSYTLRTAGRAVAVHCDGAGGRASTLCALHLVRAHGFGARAAAAWLRIACPGMRMAQRQLDYLADVAAALPPAPPHRLGCGGRKFGPALHGSQLDYLADALAAPPAGDSAAAAAAAAARDAAFRRGVHRAWAARQRRITARGRYRSPLDPGAPRAAAAVVMDGDDGEDERGGGALARLGARLREAAAAAAGPRPPGWRWWPLPPPAALGAAAVAAAGALGCPAAGAGRGGWEEGCQAWGPDPPGRIPVPCAMR